MPVTSVVVRLIPQIVIPVPVSVVETGARFIAAVRVCDSLPDVNRLQVMVVPKGMTVKFKPGFDRMLGIEFAGDITFECEVRGLALQVVVDYLTLVAVNYEAAHLAVYRNSIPDRGGCGIVAS